MNDLTINFENSSSLTRKNLFNMNSSITLESLDSRKMNRKFKKISSQDLFKLGEKYRNEKSIEKQRRFDDQLDKNKNSPSSIYITQTKHSRNLSQFPVLNSMKIDKFENKEMVTLPIILAKHNNNITRNKEKTISIPTAKKDKVSEFIIKTRQIQLMRYSIDVKKEHISRLQEVYSNKFETLKESTSAIEKAKHDEELIIVQKAEYLKHLQNQKILEDQYYDALRAKKHKLETELRHYELKMDKLTNQLETNKTYRNFLICVKERKLIPDQIKHIKSYFITSLKGELDSVQMMSKQDSKIRSNEGKGGIRKTSKLDTYVIQKKIRNKLSENDLFDQYYKIMFEKHGNLYKTQDDFINDIRMFEHNNYLLLGTINHDYAQLEDYKRKLIELEKSDKKDNDHIGVIQNIKENEMVKLIEQNKKLSDEKIKLLEFTENPVQKDSSSLFVQGISSKINSKINETYYSCLKAKINKKKRPNSFSSVNSRRSLANRKSTMSSQNHNADQKYKLFKKLLLVEKTFYYLLESLSGLSETHTLDLKIIQKDIEKQRLLKNSFDQKNNMLLKSEILQKKIMEKLKKVYVKPKRRVASNHKPFESKAKKQEILNSEDNININDLLSIDD